MPSLSTPRQVLLGGCTSRRRRGNLPTCSCETRATAQAGAVSTVLASPSCVRVPITFCRCVLTCCIYGCPTVEISRSSWFGGLRCSRLYDATFFPRQQCAQVVVFVVFGYSNIFVEIYRQFLFVICGKQEGGRGAGTRGGESSWHQEGVLSGMSCAPDHLSGLSGVSCVFCV